MEVLQDDGWSGPGQSEPRRGDGKGVRRRGSLGEGDGSEPPAPLPQEEPLPEHEPKSCAGLSPQWMGQSFLVASEAAQKSWLHWFCLTSAQVTVTPPQSQGASVAASDAFSSAASAMGQAPPETHTMKPQALSSLWPRFRPRAYLQ